MVALETLPEEEQCKALEAFEAGNGYYFKGKPVSRPEKAEPSPPPEGEAIEVLSPASGGGEEGGEEIAKIAAAVSRATLNLSAIKKLPIPERKAIIAPWLMESSMGFIYGPRGLGKTWFSYHLALQVAKGGTFGPWKVKAPTPVLYIDGEMPLKGKGTIERIESLSDTTPENFRLLHHEVVFHQSEISLNISNPAHQKAITGACQSVRAKVLFIDNLSCLTGGVRENEGDDWAAALLPWALELRRRHISLVMIHHAGRNGRMRGTSRREDPADWIIKLSDSPDSPIAEDGEARFTMSFEKNRGADEPCPSLDWHFKRAGKVTSPAFKEASIETRIIDLVDSGIVTCGEIAQELGLSKSQASKVAARLIAGGRMEKEGREYRLPTSRDYK